MLCQTASDLASSPQPGESKRLFGIVPNYRTSGSLVNYQPVSAKEKFNIASQDAFDRGTVILAAAFAGESQLTNASPSFGQGGAGYGRYFGTSYADYVIGDYMTEGIFPTLLHQDPRYFRKGTGSGFSRLSYACGQIFLTHYPDNRDASDAVSKLGTQLGVDMASNILKEFWPDISRKFSRKHN
jgi:hypothetical protein